MSFQVLDERIAWATDITRVPADPSLVYGGTIVMRRSDIVPVFINAMPQQVTQNTRRRTDDVAQKDIVFRWWCREDERNGGRGPTSVGDKSSR